jgi:F0F1-type ATP synthase membrane subunit c/vacuolar-type H+-ATPase subunit K
MHGTKRFWRVTLVAASLAAAYPLFLAVGGVAELVRLDAREGEPAMTGSMVSLVFAIFGVVASILIFGLVVSLALLGRWTLRRRANAQ